MANKLTAEKAEIERKTKNGVAQTAAEFKSAAKRKALQELLREDVQKAQPANAFSAAEEELTRRRGGVGGKFLGAMPKESQKPASSSTNELPKHARKYLRK